MGATESSYRKLGAKAAKLQCVQRRKVEEGDEESRKGQKRRRDRRESLFSNAQWNRRRGSDVAEWPAWYHGWCTRAEVGKEGGAAGREMNGGGRKFEKGSKNL